MHVKIAACLDQFWAKGLGGLSDLLEALKRSLRGCACLNAKRSHQEESAQWKSESFHRTRYSPITGGAPVIATVAREVKLRNCCASTQRKSCCSLVAPQRMKKK